MAMIKPNINAADSKHLNKTAEDEFYSSANFKFNNTKDVVDGKRHAESCLPVEFEAKSSKEAGNILGKIYTAK